MNNRNKVIEKHTKHQTKQNLLIHFQRRSTHYNRVSAPGRSEHIVQCFHFTATGANTEWYGNSRRIGGQNTLVKIVDFQ